MMSIIKRFVKPILKRLIVEIVEELLQDKAHFGVMYKVSNSEIDIKANLFFENLLKDRIKRNLKPKQ
jgi:hypothetical protein